MGRSLVWCTFANMPAGPTGNRPYSGAIEALLYVIAVLQIPCAVMCILRVVSQAARDQPHPMLEGLSGAGLFFGLPLFVAACVAMLGYRMQPTRAFVLAAAGFAIDFLLIVTYLAEL